MNKIATSLLALTLALFLAAPATADFDPYGSIRLSTFWVEKKPAADGAQNDHDLWFELNDISRFGAKFRTGDIGGRVEFGLKGAGAGNNDAYTRLLYGTWDFGGGTLLVGQDYPEYTFCSAQVAPRTNVDDEENLTNVGRRNQGVIDGENAMYGYGCLWEARKPQIEVKMDNGLYVELLRPERSSTGPNGAPEDGEADTILPKMVVGYNLKAENLFLGPGVAYNRYNYEYEAFDEWIESYLIYLKGKAALGMIDLQWNLHYGQNLSDFDIWGRELASAAQYDAARKDVENSECLGGYVQVAFNIDPATITIGYGYTQSENDRLGLGDLDEQQTCFVNSKLPFADTFYVVPEFSYYDGADGPSGEKQDDEWALGMMWRADF
jgi:hypothetical protein